MFKPHLVKADVAFQPFLHHPDLHNGIALVHAVPENNSQIADHPADLILFFLNGHPVDGIQCIVQEMRIDLCLQRADLRILLPVRRRLHFLYEVLHLHGHLVKVFRNPADLIPADHPDLRVHVAALHPPDPAHHLIHRTVDLTDQTQDRRCRSQNRQSADGNIQPLGTGHVPQDVLPIISVIKNPSRHRIFI